MITNTRQSTDKKILVIDDDVSFSKMLVDYFMSQGYWVCSAQQMDEAIKLSRKNKPKVVLLDFNMPLVTGDQLLPVLQEVNPQVKAIVITGCTGDEVEERFKGLGYFAYFEKGGLSLESLKEKVEEAMNY